MADAHVFMDYEHNAIHQGRFYTWSDKQTITTGSYLEYGFQTGEYYVHVKPAVLTCSADQLTGQFFMDCSYTGGTVTDNPCNRNHLSTKNATMTGVVSPNVSYTIAATQAGGGFTNQPAGDGIEIVSSSAADTTQTVTIYGTVTGSTTVVTSETVTLTGATEVPTVIVAWQNILGIELSAATVGNITVREASGDQTVTTITSGVLSAGVATQTLLNAYGSIPRHDASGASTSPVGIVGKTQSGSSISSVAALNGSTEENHGSTVFWDVTKVLIGAVASNVNTWILSQRPGKKFSGFYLPGATGVGQTRTGSEIAGTNEFILKPHTKYVIRYDNASSSSNVIGWSLHWYEEGEA